MQVTLSWRTRTKISINTYPHVRILSVDLMSVSESVKMVELNNHKEPEMTSPV